MEVDGDPGGPQVRLIAFTEPPAPEQREPILLHVYIINGSPAVRWILNDLDSINIPQALHQGRETSPEAELVHVDFGASPSASYVRVATGEAVKITLLLREEQSALLARVRRMDAPVKFRGHEHGDVTTVLLPATVYTVKP